MTPLSLEGLQQNCARLHTASAYNGLLLHASPSKGLIVEAPTGQNMLEGVPLWVGDQAEAIFY